MVLNAWCGEWELIVNGKGSRLNILLHRTSCTFTVFVVSLFVIPLSCFPLFAETSSSQDYLDQEIQLDTGDTPALDNFQAESSTTRVDRSSSSMTWYLLKTLLVLVVLSAGVWGLLKFMKSTGIGGASNPFMSIHSTLALGQSQYLQIVQVGKRFYMLGVTDSQVQLLGEIEDEDTITDLRLYSGTSEEETESNQNKGFQKIFQQFVGTGQHGFQNENEENKSETELSDLRTKIQNLRKSGGEA